MWGKKRGLLSRPVGSRAYIVSMFSFSRHFMKNCSECLSLPSSRTFESINQTLWKKSKGCGSSRRKNSAYAKPPKNAQAHHNRYHSIRTSRLAIHSASLSTLSPIGPSRPKAIRLTRPAASTLVESSLGMHSQQSKKKIGPTWPLVPRSPPSLVFHLDTS
ncbi:hypothetical protein FOTG_17447 [Fusarium oxysporum f. sp. vasinfectum 25433]|uniref:Uncharacterized protein n=1 Tax=Fusarium oxysporum f. sp. vasinfectum 25433 TaxID=1089449 RepID=X0KKS0_FUSOX|nr:hypothetical protein FOTG_17447 [Fusarium oxysporum f. sp. vasinfectum 25433]